jgi:hypothetical protein
MRRVLSEEIEFVKDGTPAVGEVVDEVVVSGV